MELRLSHSSPPKFTASQRRSLAPRKQMSRRVLVVFVSLAWFVSAVSSDEEDSNSDADILASAAYTASVALVGGRAWQALQSASNGLRGASRPSTQSKPTCDNCSSESEEESDDEEILRVSSFRVPRTPSRFASNSAAGSTMNAQQQSSVKTPLCNSASSSDSLSSSRLSTVGKYTRSEVKGKRSKYNGGPDSQLQLYLGKVRSGQLIGEMKCCCSPLHSAPARICKDDMQTRMLKRCAESCYGENVLVTGQTDVSNHKAVHQWFKLVFDCRVVCPDTGGVKEIDYRVQGIKVCKTVFAACYGMTSTTFEKIERRVEAGDYAWRAARRKGRHEAQDQTSMFVAAVAWWISIFSCFDNTTKRGWLIYDVRNWRTTYEDEFIPTMKSLGFSWRSTSKMLEGNGAVQDDLEGDVSATESGMNDDYGSKSSWYRARNVALKRFAEKTYTEGADPFKLASRKKHSAYKECTECQTNRIGKADAIRTGESYEVINEWTQKQAAHVTWFRDQRYAMEAFRQAGGRGNWLSFEQADKCGDSCLYLPGSGRINSSNAGKYSYHVSLQANIFPGKLINGYLLLPSLRTGANFGATSFLYSICNAIKAGMITRETKSLYRGSDGGSENVGFTMHGVHINLVRATQKDLVWARLPPDHSHDYCDRWFSAVEGFVKDAYAKGVNTLGQLLRLLAEKHTGSEYRMMKLHLSILLCNYNFDAWIEGCLRTDKVKGIKTPLVYWYHWDEVAGTVRVFFKHSVAAESTFERDEWGPWKNVWVESVDQNSGQLQKVQVKRTVPEGVEMEVAVPDFSKSPGVEAWLEDEDWSRERVFSDISKWHYHKDSNKYKAVWNALGHWHSVNRLARAMEPGATTITLGDEEMPLTNYTWEEMWCIIRSIGPETGTAPTPIVNAVPLLSQRAPVRKSSRPDRGAIHNSNSLHVLNSVSHPGYTEADRRRDRLSDHQEWLSHLNRNWSTQGQLWLFQLEHFEGEYRIGLGRRLFAEHETDEEWEVEWFERLNKAFCWGASPGFKVAVKEYNHKRQPVPYTSTEPHALLVPVVCEVTNKCTEHAPRLTQACSAAIHEWAKNNHAWREHNPQPKKAQIQHNLQPEQAQITNQREALRLRAGASNECSETEPSETDTESESEVEESGEEGQGTNTEAVLPHSPCEFRKHLRRRCANNAARNGKPRGEVEGTQARRARAEAKRRKTPRN
jgi:hypothetical protein